MTCEIEKSCVFPGSVQLGKFFKYFSIYFVHNSLVLWVGLKPRPDY